MREISEISERSEARYKRSDERSSGIEERGERSSETFRSTLDQVRSELRSQVSDFQKKQHEDASAIKLLQMDQAQNSQVMSRLQEDLRKESTARVALEQTARSSADTAERALRTSEQARQASLNFEGDFKERLEILEVKISKTQMESLKKLSVPDRIMYFQQAHSKAALKDREPGQENDASAEKVRQPLFRKV